jgi:hypothetical protein
MAADEHLSAAQFSTWYHGTTSDEARKIQREGLTSKSYGGEVDEQGPLAYNPTLAARPTRASNHAIHRAAQAQSSASVVEVHVPHHLAGEYLVNEGPVAGLNKPLPPSMIHSVKDL